MMCYGTLCNQAALQGERKKEAFSPAEITFQSFEDLFQYVYVNTTIWIIKTKPLALLLPMQLSKVFACI